MFFEAKPKKNFRGRRRAQAAAARRKAKRLNMYKALKAHREATSPRDFGRRIHDKAPRLGVGSLEPWPA